MAPETVSKLPLEPLLVDARAAARLVGISLATWHRLKSARRIGPAPVRLGGRVLYRVGDLRLWTEWGCPPLLEFEARLSANGQPRPKVGR